MIYTSTMPKPSIAKLFQNGRVPHFSPPLREVG
jgi:hypothetical protein